MDNLHETEIGTIAPNWKQSTLGDVAKFQTGGTPSRNEPKYWEKGDIPWVKTGEIDYRVIDVTEEKITRMGLESSSTKVFRAGTLLVAMYGQGVTRGRAGILGIDAATNQACAAIMPHDENEILTRFVYFFLQYQYEALRQMGHGANQRNLNMALLRGFPIAYPPLSEQRRIAGVLGLVQRAVEQQERLRTLVAELKQTLLHHLFTHGLRGEPQKPTDLGPIPQSWDVVKLGDYLTEAQYGISVKGAQSGDHALLRMTNQKRGRITSENLQFVSLPPTQFEKFRVEKHDILFNRTNSLELVGRTAIFDLVGDFVFASYLIRLRTDASRLRPHFLNHYFNCEETQTRLKSIATRAVSQSNISATRLRGFVVPVPTPAEQDEVVETIDCLDCKREVHVRKHSSLTSLFRTLLHQLMTAQLRVSDLNVESLLGSAISDSSRRLVSD